jgi:hypothetical protein
VDGCLVGMLRGQGEVGDRTEEASMVCLFRVGV